jgi:predicted AlkP superfamily pyrophosphatase or phosphodiesterase
VPSLISDILPLLESHRLPNWPFGNEFICPHYTGYSLYNLPASVCHWLDAPLSNSSPLNKELLDAPKSSIKHIIQIVMDGLGLDWFLNYLQSGRKYLNGVNAWNDILNNATLAPLTSVVPSTTSTALTTFWTGRSPLEHGILGYELWLKEFGILSNMITLSPASSYGDYGSLSRSGFQPTSFLNVSTLGQHLVAHGIQPYGFIPQPISRSGLSSMHLSDTKVMPYKTLSDLWISMEKLINTQGNSPTYVYAYYSDLDTLSHQYGPHDERVMLEFSLFSQSLGQFIHTLSQNNHEETLLLITADHGFISTPANPDYDLTNHPELLKNLVMFPCGENRLPYLYIHPGKEHLVRSYIEQTWDGKFYTLTVEQALSSGLFGPSKIQSNYQERLGDLIVIPHNEAYWWWAIKKNPLLGRHGGLSRQEMLIPLIMIEL